MKIAIVGLGLMGGSFAKAISANTCHQVLGLDRDSETIRLALASGAISQAISPAELEQADACLVCLFPQQTIDFLLQHRQHFRPGAILADICGVKQAVIDQVDLPLQQAGVQFIGTHPMAGGECSGFVSARVGLFAGASWIVTPTNRTSQEAQDFIRTLGPELDFAQVVTATPQEHDRIIAYTSQLAHIASSAYIKSAAHERERGFSAGSFQDMTRVAKLDEVMWTDLFAKNRQNLLTELDVFLGHLNEYRQALASQDDQAMQELLAAGRRLKEST